MQPTAIGGRRGLRDAKDQWESVSAHVVDSLPTSNPLQKLYWIASLNEIVHILRTDSGHIDLLLVIGIILAVLGTAFRYASYRYLAEAFTFELVNAGERAKDPTGSARLVVDGPYDLVRHPSYTGWLIGTFGFIMVPFAEGSWIQTQAQSPVKVLVYTWVFIFVVSFIVTVVPRMAKEDEMMKKQFGEEWERWAHRVRYRLIPFIY